VDDAAVSAIRQCKVPDVVFIPCCLLIFKDMPHPLKNGVGALNDDPCLLCYDCVAVPVLTGIKVLWLKKAKTGWTALIEERAGQMYPLPGTSGKPIKLQRARVGVLLRVS
jgi:hypothetical protein